VRKKSNNLGIGASGTDTSHNWLASIDTFNTLLKDLNKANGTENGEIATDLPKQKVIPSANLAKKKRFQSKFVKAGNHLKSFLGLY
jgi:hypothetical protein